MPTKLIFRNHSDLGLCGVHDYNLYGRKLVPTDLLFHRMRESGRDYFTEYVQASEVEQAKWNRKLDGPQTLMYWMLQMVSEIEKALKDRSLSWTFERHYFSIDCDEDSENAIAISAPRWLITIRDDKDDIVHPGWAIAMDETWGDLQIVRAEPGSANCFNSLKFDWTKCRSDYLPFLLTTMRRHLRQHAEIRRKFL